MVHDFASEFVSGGLPAGLDTVWGWLAKHEPEALCFMEAPGADASQFEDAAKDLAQIEGIDPTRVPAPSAIRESGGPEEVLVFPTLLLRAVFAVR